MESTIFWSQFLRYTHLVASARKTSFYKTISMWVFIASFRLVFGTLKQGVVSWSNSKIVPSLEKITIVWIYPPPSNRVSTRDYCIFINGSQYINLHMQHISSMQLTVRTWKGMVGIVSFWGKRPIFRGCVSWNLKLTACPWKSMVGRWNVLFGPGLFSEALLAVGFSERMWNNRIGWPLPRWRQKLPLDRTWCSENWIDRSKCW